MLQDILLAEREFVTLPAPIAVFCALHKCQTLIKPGTPVKKYDGATFVHVTCPTGQPKVAAAHKHPNTGMTFR